MKFSNAPIGRISVVGAMVIVEGLDQPKSVNLRKDLRSHLSEGAANITGSMSGKVKYYVG